MVSDMKAEVGIEFYQSEKNAPIYNFYLIKQVPFLFFNKITKKF